MDINSIMEMVMGQGVFAGLFIWLFFTYQKESKEREDRLTGIIDKQSERLETITLNLEKISDELDVLKTRQIH